MGPDNDAVSLDELLELVRLVCTQDRVKHLLRKAKEAGGDKSTVRVSGKFDALVSQHLRDAIQVGAVSRSAVYDLVGESEESGKQHIFYYKPRDEKVIAHYNDGRRIAERLFGASWEAERGFPHYHIRSTGLEWADFRIVPAAQAGRCDWVAKLYSGVMREKHVDTIREAPSRAEGPSRIIKIFEEFLSREIYLARWHHFGLLELRVPLEPSHKALWNSVLGLWNAIEPAVSSDAFEPFDLMSACRRIINQYADHAGAYRLGDTHLLDPQGGSAKISPRSGEDHLMHDDVRRRAIELFDQCRMLVVIWLLDEGSHDTKEELRSVIGKIRPNEVVIASRTTDKAVLNVTHQLCRFAG